MLKDSVQWDSRRGAEAQRGNSIVAESLRFWRVFILSTEAKINSYKRFSLRPCASAGEKSESFGSRVQAWWLHPLWARGGKLAWQDQPPFPRMSVKGGPA